MRTQTAPPPTRVLPRRPRRRFAVTALLIALVGAPMAVLPTPLAPRTLAAEPGADPPYTSSVTGMYGDRQIRIPTSAADGRASFAVMTPDASMIVVGTTQDLDPDTEIHPMDPYGDHFGLIGDRALRFEVPGSASVRRVTDDGTTVVIATATALLPLDPGDDLRLYLLDAAGPHFGPMGSNDVAGMTPDASYIVVESRLKLVPADTDTWDDLYIWTRASGRMRLVTTEPGIAEFRFAAMTDDGNHVIYDAGIGAGLYDWTPTGTTLVANGNFHQLSDDGRTIYFDTYESLDPTDQDDAQDGYVRRPDGYHVLTEPTSSDTGLVTVKADGSAWVFQTADQLVPADQDPFYDLYIVDGGPPTLMSQGTFNGENLMMSEDFSSGVFSTLSTIDPADTDQLDDVYRWAAADPDQLELLASQGNGRVFPLAYAPDGSRVLLKTAGQLIAQDTDPFDDVYEWVDGDLGLVFPGDTEYTVKGWSADLRRVVASVPGALIPEDVNGAGDLYIADLDLVAPEVEIDPPVQPSGPATSLTFETADDDGVWFECQVDGGTFDPCRSPVAVTGLTGGAHTMIVRGFDAAWNADEATVSWSTDATPPTASPPVARFVTGSTAGATTTPVRIIWPASQDASGIDRYELSQQTDGGSWQVVATTTGTAAVRSLTSGRTYRFRVRSIDEAGNATIALGAPLKVTAREEGSSLITYRGTWTRSSSTAYHAGAAKFSTRSGASAELLLVGSSVAWMASVGPSKGSARVYVDGVYAGTVSLYAKTSANRRLVFVTSWPTAGSHRIEVRSLGTSGHPRIDVDAFLVN